ncbi:DUF4838 domain-containing protein, partial [bacterium]|nr:DUF4838 domain-containing protein [bacterium]
QDHVYRISGARLPVVPDTAAVKGPRILVGQSAATEQLGLRSRSFRDQEHCIRFLPDTLVLIGRDETEKAVQTAPRTVEGKFGKAQQFAGAQVIQASDFQFDDDAGTMEAWVWMPAAKPEKHGTILRLDSGDPWTYHIVQRDGNSNCISYTTWDSKKGHGCRSGELAEGWHHIVATHDAAAGKMELFIDGVSVGKSDYVKTSCRGMHVGIGGYASSGGVNPGNCFIGKIDEVRITGDVRTPTSGAAGGPYEPEARTLLLMHLDEPGKMAANAAAQGEFRFNPPGVFQSNGTLNAVYDFLERYCDVRWYAPGEIGIVCPQTKTLVARGNDLRRRPDMDYRWIAGAQLYMPTPKEPVPARDNHMWKLRMRLGGNYRTTGHSFYGYYDRYLKDHPDWFAQGYTGKPPQMCYTNPEFIAQVVQDARDFFDGKGAKSGAAAQGDIFGLVPMDNSSWCKCPRCQAELNPAEKDNPQFNNGWASDYIYNFTNKVAREVAKTHPDKWIGQLAYSTYAYYPTKVVPDKNVSVQMCLHTRNWWCPSMEANDRKVLAEWRRGSAERPLHLWLYYCFPALNAKYGNYTYWPGFFAHSVVKQMKLYHDAHIMGIFLENSSECGATYLMDQVEYYVTFKLADDPTLDGNKLIEEFFTRYYGHAAGPMKALYNRIEDIYGNPKYYPPEIQKSPGHQHQNEKLAWDWLGKPERMAELARLMAQAKAAAQTDVEKERVRLWEVGIWQPLTEGAQKAAAHKQGRLTPPPTVTVPKVTGAAGDAARVDWQQAADLKGWGGLSGDPIDRKIETWAARDDQFLYLRLVDHIKPRSLTSGSSVWDGDDFELFFAPARDTWYRQLCVAPNGKVFEQAWKTDNAEWQSGVVVQSDVRQPDRWTLLLALPLEKLLPGLKTGGKLYANFYRHGPGGPELLAWTPPYEAGFHTTSRLAEFLLP